MAHSDPAEVRKRSGGALEVRRADTSDGPHLAELRQLWTRELGAISDDPGFPERLEDWLIGQSRWRRFWLALAEDRPIAMVNLLVFERMPRPGRSDTRWGYVGNMYVVPEWRGTGVSSRLLAAVTSYSEDRGLEKLLVHPSERSISFWRRAGFEVADDLLALRFDR